MQSGDDRAAWPCSDRGLPVWRRSPSRPSPWRCGASAEPRDPPHRTSGSRLRRPFGDPVTARGYRLGWITAAGTCGDSAYHGHVIATGLAAAFAARARRRSSRPEPAVGSMGGARLPRPRSGHVSVRRTGMDMRLAEPGAPSASGGIRADRPARPAGPRRSSPHGAASWLPPTSARPRSSRLRRSTRRPPSCRSAIPARTNAYAATGHPATATLDSNAGRTFPTLWGTSWDAVLRCSRKYMHIKPLTDTVALTLP